MLTLLYFFAASVQIFYVIMDIYCLCFHDSSHLLHSKVHLYSLTEIYSEKNHQWASIFSNSPLFFVFRIFSSRGLRFLAPSYIWDCLSVIFLFGFSNSFLNAEFYQNFLSHVLFNTSELMLSKYLSFT